MKTNDQDNFHRFGIGSQVMEISRESGIKQAHKELHVKKNYFKTNILTSI